MLRRCVAGLHRRLTRCAPWGGGGSTTAAAQEAIAMTAGRIAAGAAVLALAGTLALVYSGVEDEVAPMVWVSMTEDRKQSFS